jgi:hypothetical protein
MLIKAVEKCFGGVNAIPAQHALEFISNLRLHLYSMRSFYSPSEQPKHHSNQVLACL